MTSVQTRYAQYDTREEDIQLTGYVKNNGAVTSINNVPPQQPAYAAIDLTKSRNFCIDARVLELRTDSVTGLEYLLRIYVDSTKPPLYYTNFEYNIFITLPPITSTLVPGNFYLSIEFFDDEDSARSINQNYSFALTNQADNGDIKQGVAVMTLQVSKNRSVLKSVSPSLFL